MRKKNIRTDNVQANFNPCCVFLFLSGSALGNFRLLDVILHWFSVCIVGIAKIFSFRRGLDGSRTNYGNVILRHLRQRTIINSCDTGSSYCHEFKKDFGWNSAHHNCDVANLFVTSFLNTFALNLLETLCSAQRN